MAVSPPHPHTLIGVNPPVRPGDAVWNVLTSARPERCKVETVDSIAERYRVIRESSNSPLLTDQECCLEALEALLSSIWASTESGTGALALEMEERRLKLMNAMQTGTEM